MAGVIIPVENNRTWPNWPVFSTGIITPFMNSCYPLKVFKRVKHLLVFNYYISFLLHQTQLELKSATQLSCTSTHYEVAFKILGETQTQHHFATSY